MKFNDRLNEFMGKVSKVKPMKRKRTAQSLKSKWKYGKDEEGNVVKIKKSEDEIAKDYEKAVKNDKALSRAERTYKSRKRKARGIDPSKEIEKMAKAAVNEDEDDMVIRTTYETWGEDDLEAGDTDNRGWEDEEGVIFDTVEDAIGWLQDKGAIHASSSQFHPGVWYSTESEQDYSSGESTTYSFHLSGFSEEDEEKIYDEIAFKYN